MRVVAGIYGGRRLVTPKNDSIRPTSDKARGAIFNILRGYGCVEDAVVLDLFCGTGALGIEALSQGATSCTFVDSSRTSLDLAKENAKALDVEHATFVLSKAVALKNLPQKASLVFMDPPYNKDLIMPCLDHLDRQGLLALEAVLVIESEKRFQFSPAASYRMLNEKIYGDTKVMFLQYAAIDQGE